MNDILELHEFFVEGGKQNRSHVLLHISEPDANEKHKGYFFAIAEINNGSMEQIEHLQQMIDDLESGYYETEDENPAPNAAPSVASGKKNAFELSLEFINRRGHHVLQHQNSITNCLVGVLRGHDLFLAYHGNPQATLFYQGSEEMEKLNVLEDQDETAGEQLFSSMIQGNINTGDYLYISTPHVADYFSLDRIKKIIISRTTRQSAEHIERVLKDMRNDLSFGGIIFHFPNKEDIPKTGKMLINMNAEGSQKSLDNLINQERNTDETLSPPFLGGIKKKMNDLKKFNKNSGGNSAILSKPVPESNYRVRDKKESLLNTILIAIGRGIVLSVVSIYKFVKYFFIYLWKSIVISIILITNRDSRRSEILKSFRHFLVDKKEQFISLPLLSKVLFLGVIVFALIFFGSIGFIKLREINQAKEIAYQNLLQAIEDKKTAADASLIYGDDAKALSLLQEATDLINQLSAQYKDSEKIAEFTPQIDATLTKLRKMNVIQPELVANLKDLKPEANTTRLAAIDGKLIAYGPDDQNFYIVRPDSKQTEVKEHSVISNLLEANTPKEQDIIVFLTKNNTLAEFNKESNLLSNKEISFPHENTSAKNLFVYNRKIYLLDGANNQIYKHSPTQTGYDKGQDWLKGEVDVREGVSLAIDGDLFLLKANGEILKFTAGEKQDFNISGLNPKLENPVQIWTYNGVNNLYILEPKNKRVVVLSKEGKLLNQYTSSQWIGPSGMVVDEAKKTVFILDDNKVYKFSID